jgi:hypothetical protein
MMVDPNPTNVVRSEDSMLDMNPGMLPDSDASGSLVEMTPAVVSAAPGEVYHDV